MAAMNTPSTSESIMQMLDEGQKKEEIITRLMAQGLDEQFAAGMLRETARLRANKLRTQGLTFILVGAVVYFGSFLLTITSDSLSGSFPYVLYGLTSLGILLVFFGFVKIF